MAGGLLGQGSLTTYNPTFRERATDLLRGLLFSDDREGQRKAERLSNVLETITPYGVATGIDDAKDAIWHGDYATAGMMGAMAMVPGPSPKIRAYHGSPHSFDRFDMSKGRTAKHIYTTPIEADAKHYGKNTYEVEIGGRIGDFRPDYRGPEQYRTLAAVYEDQGLSDYFDSFDDFVEAFDSGDMYQRFANQRAQNSVMDGFAEQGFDAVQIPDAGFGGSGSESIVVLNPQMIEIVRKYGIAGASAMLGYNILNMVDPAQARQMQEIDAQRPQMARSGW